MLCQLTDLCYAYRVLRSLSRSSQPGFALHWSHDLEMVNQTPGGSARNGGHQQQEQKDYAAEATPPQELQVYRPFRRKDPVSDILDVRRLVVTRYQEQGVGLGVGLSQLCTFKEVGPNRPEEAAPHQDGDRDPSDFVSPPVSVLAYINETVHDVFDTTVKRAVGNVNASDLSDRLDQVVRSQNDTKNHSLQTMEPVKAIASLPSVCNSLKRFGKRPAVLNAGTKSTALIKNVSQESKQDQQEEVPGTQPARAEDDHAIVVSSKKNPKDGSTKTNHSWNKTHSCFTIIQSFPVLERRTSKKWKGYGTVHRREMTFKDLCHLARLNPRWTRAGIQSRSAAPKFKKQKVPTR